MTIAMKTSGDGTTPGGSEPGQETTALGNTVCTIMITFSYFTILKLIFNVLHL